MLREKRGITLIALVVTIIVLLILAAVSINSILGENGIVTQAKKAQDKTRQAQIEEELRLKLADLEIEGYTTGSANVSSIFNDMLVGLYSYRWWYDNSLDGYVDEFNGVYMDGDTIFETVITLEWIGGGTPELKVGDINVVKSVNPMSEALLYFMDEDESKIEIIDENYSDNIEIYGTKYKNIVYDVYCTWGDDSESYTIAKREELTAKTWSNVFLDDYDRLVYTIDSDGKLWRMTSETTGICMSNIYPELASVKIKDAIYNYDRYNEQYIVGFIGTNGDMYFINYSEYTSDMFININEMFPEQLGNIDAKLVIPVQGYEGFMDSVYSINYYTFYDSIVLDTNGKIWIFEYYMDDDWEVAVYAKCVNNDISELASVSFCNVLASDRYSPNYSPSPVEYEARYPTILGLDSNGKVWKIQLYDARPTNYSYLSHYNFEVECVSETESLPVIKSINYGNEWSHAIMLGENNILYEYITFCYSDASILDSTDSIFNGDIAIKETNGYIVLGTNGDVYNVFETLYTEFDGNTIVDIYAYNWALDDSGDIWYYNYGSFYDRGNLENTNLKKVSTSRDFFAAIDENGKLTIIYGEEE